MTTKSLTFFLLFWKNLWI